MAPDDPPIRFLYSLQQSGIKAGLGNIRVLTQFLDHPEHAFPCVHVAGTNGKGSTSAMIAAVLTAAGYRTGLYTSPHLRSFTERIRIDGRKIPMGRVAGYARRLRPAIRRTGATFFEATTALAFRYFADERVDIAVIETGLGGRLDSTNVVSPLVSVITSVGLEHREYLGGTIGKIAFEKAGIIKPGVPCVVGGLGPTALAVVRRRASRVGAPLVQAFRNVPSENISTDPWGLTGDFRPGGKWLRSLRVGTPGTYQEGNVKIALQVLAILDRGRDSFGADEQAARRGLSSLRELTGFSGRLQVLRVSPPVIADVAHNPDGIRALAGALRATHSGKFRIVFGVMRDKEYRPMIDQLAPLCRMFYFVAPRSERARDPRELTSYAHRTGVPARLAGSVESAISAAISEGGRGQPVLLTGSHFLVGEAMEALGVGV